MGSPQSGHRLCSRSRCSHPDLVVSVDYRLAPEDPFLRAWTTALRRFDGSTNADPPGRRHRSDRRRRRQRRRRARSLPLATRPRPWWAPSTVFQPCSTRRLDDRTPLTDGDDALVWSAVSNRYAWSAYLGYRTGRQEPAPYAAAARRADLAGLPPAWIGVGDIDLFHDEAVDYARRLRTAGVEVQLHVEPGMYHAADAFVPGAPSMLRFRERIVAAVGAALAATTDASRWHATRPSLVYQPPAERLGGASSVTTGRRRRWGSVRGRRSPSAVRGRRRIRRSCGCSVRTLRRSRASPDA